MGWLGRLIVALRTLRALKVLVLVFGFGIFVFYMLFLHRPSWWVEGGDSSPAASALGLGVEQAVVREFTLVRERGDWGFVLGTEDVNAWIVNRFEDWAASRDELSLPDGVSRPRIRFGDGWIEGGLLTHQLGVGVMSTVRFEARVMGRDIELKPIDAHFGPFDMTREGLAYLADYSVLDDRIEYDLSGVLSIPAVIHLVDGRRVLIEDLEIVDGEIAIRCQTVGP